MGYLYGISWEGLYAALLYQLLALRTIVFMTFVAELCLSCSIVIEFEKHIISLMLRIYDLKLSEFMSVRLINSIFLHMSNTQHSR